MPERIQLKRTKGWRKPEGAVIVSRPSRWGNFYAVDRNEVMTERGIERKGDLWVVVNVDPRGRRHQGTRIEFAGFADRVEATTFAVDLYERTLLALWAGIDGRHRRKWYLDGLAGHDLGCWCSLDSPWPCHADFLLTAANEPVEAFA